MNRVRANTGSPELIQLVFNAWTLGYTGEQVISYVVFKSGCTVDEANIAMKEVYETMKE
jgi:hypothetical protein